jgi:hypothetical protein
MTRDARLPALHRGDFGLPGPALPSPSSTSAGASAGGSVTASSSRPGLSAWRAGSLPPGATVASRYRRTPHLAPPSGSPPETPLDERGCESSSIDANRSQEINANCIAFFVRGRPDLGNWLRLRRAPAHGREGDVRGLSATKRRAINSLTREPHPIAGCARALRVIQATSPAPLSAAARPARRCRG